VYVVVRLDLADAQQAVQACHACINSARTFPYPDQHPHLVLLGVADEAALAAVVADLDRAGLPHATFREPDLGDQLTAVATAPLYAQERDFFRSFQLKGRS